MEKKHYELIVIGSGPAGQKGAIAAAKLGKSVAIIDRQGMLGGVSLHAGTIPSKTLREAVLYLTGFRQRSFYGQDYVVKDNISKADLGFRIQTVVERETNVINQQLRRNGIAVLSGTAHFRNPHTLEVVQNGDSRLIEADNVLIACGTRAARNPEIPFDGKRIVTCDELRDVQALPRDFIIVGAGVIGLEYASMCAALNIRVTLVEQRPTILDFVDEEIVEGLQFHLRGLGMTFRLGEKVTRVQKDNGTRVLAELESGKRIHADGLLYAVGRQANTDLLNVEAAGLTADPRGKIKVNEHFQTDVPHIYAAGDVVGFPALAATSMEQGRRAVCTMFGRPATAAPQLLPFGIYTIPEISMVGRTERELTSAKIPYEVGVANYAEMAKGLMVGDQTGLLKILFHLESHQVLGVHAMGENATEIIHIAQAVMAHDGKIEYFRDAVFNYPTFAEAYKVAALNGLNKLEA